MTGFQLEDVLPLTPLQSGMLFHALYDSRAVDVYTAQFVFDLEGPVSVPALHAAIAGLLRRHANLRVGFLHEDLDEPVQAVAAEVPVPLEELDLGAVEAGGTVEERLAAFLEADRTRRFDLTTPPLMRFTLVRTAPQHHRLVMTSHHILLDGWSMPLLVRELLELYARGGDDSAMPRVAPYRSYLAWLAQQDRGAALDAWRTALAGVEAPTLLAGRGGGASTGSGELPQTVVLDLDAATTGRLRETARDRRLTLNTLVQGAWGLLLGHLTGRDDAIFGTTVSGRPPEIPGVESMVGLFINTVPVRVRPAPGESLAAFLTRLQDEQGRLLDSQHVGLTEIRGVTGLDELFDTLAVFENYPMDAEALRAAQQGLPGLTVAGFSGSDAAHYPLTLTIAPGAALRITFGYRAELLDSDEVARTVTRMRRVLTAMADGLDRRVETLPFLLDGESEALLDQGRGRALPEWTQQSGVPATFAARAAEHPEAVAVSGRGGDLSYRELLRLSQDLASHLVGCGVGSEDGVGVLMGRDAAQVTASLAALRAGGSYVPLDPRWPAERLTGVAEVAGLRALVVDEAARDLPWVRALGSGFPVVTVDGAGRILDAETAEPGPLPVVGGGDRLAYVMFTSGSTGLPKGVGVTHGDVTALAADGTWRDGAAEAVLMHSAFVFDASTFEMWVPLLNGGRVVVAPDGPLEPAVLRDLVERHGVRTAFLTTALFHVIAETDPGALGLLRLAAAGGETAGPGVLQRLAAAYPRTAVLNVYGPTEATTFATVHHVRPDDAPGGVPAIGRPMRRHACLRAGRGAAAGAARCDGRALRRRRRAWPAATWAGPRLTAEPFRRRPVRPAGSAHVPHRRPGALGRGRRRLEFLGRADHQVKLRGFRIEPGEIEAALLAAPVGGPGRGAGPRGPPGDQRLVAYVVARAPGTPADPAAAARRPGRRLPAYMVPAGFVGARRAAADRQRQARPARAARAGSPHRGRCGRPPRTPREEDARAACSPTSSALATVGSRRRLLRPRRPLAARHPAGRPHPRGAGDRAGDPRLSSSTRPSPRWRSRPAGRRDRPARPAAGAAGTPRRCSRCRTPSSACGSSTSSKGPRPPTTSRSRCGCAARSTRTALRAGAGRRGRPARGLRTVFPSRDGDAVPAGRRRRRRPLPLHRRAGDRGRRSARRVEAGGPANRFDLAADCPSAAPCCGLPPTSTSCCSCPPHRRRRLVPGAAAARPGRRLRGPAGAAHRPGSRCRCSTPTTRCGSAPCSATRRRRAGRPAARASGARHWPACRRRPPARGPAAPAVAPHRGATAPFALDAGAADAARRAGPARAAPPCSWWLQAAPAALLSRSAPAGHPARHARRGPRRRGSWTTWSASSSTPWCCAPTCRGDPTFRDCWTGCGRPTWPPRATRTLPFDRLVEALNPERVRRPPPAVPGHADRRRTHATAGARAGRPAPRRGALAGSASPSSTCRSPSSSTGRGRRHARRHATHPRVRHRPVRRGHRPRLGRPARRAARGRRRPIPTPRPASTCSPQPDATPRLAGWQRHRRRLRRRHRARPVRGAGRPHPGRDRAGLRATRA